ncbi:MAG: toprim domain-containing protein [bacterium]|nr:toprim domain-containing protein [bacterium]
MERIKRDLTMDELVPHHTGHRPIRCPLPGHEDKKGSFMVYPETNSWWCPSHPSTPSGGSVIDYIMVEQGLDFKGAVRHAAMLKHLDQGPPTEEEQAAEVARHKREETLTVLAAYAHGQLIAESDVAMRARDYLAGRGFGLDLLRDHQVGLLTLEKLYQIQPTHPILSKFNRADFEEAGLRTANGYLLFRDTRITFPLIKRRRVLGMTFRALPGAEGNRKFVHLAGQPAGLWNLDALLDKERTAILAEGVPDAMTLAAWGLPAVGNLGLEASLNAHQFAHLKDVTLVWDNDPAGRGRVLTSARAIQAALRDGEVRILHMPGEKDINDWARGGGTPEEFQALLKAAPDLLTYQIKLLPDVKAGERMTRDAQALLHELLADVRALDVNLQDLYLKAIAKRIDSTPKSLRDMVRQIRKAPVTAATTTDGQETTPVTQPSPDLGAVFKDEIPYRAALGFDFRGDPVANIGMWLRPVPTKPPMPFVIESVIRDGKATMSLVPYAERSTQTKGNIRFPNEGLPRWTRGDTPFSMASLLADPAANTPNAAVVFQKMREAMRRFIVYPEDREYDIVAIWIMMTYFFPVFGRVGYLHFNGGSGSGKSLSLRFVEAMAFNALKTANITDAALYRTVDGSRSTLLMDEAERLSFPKAGTIEAATRSLFLDSYGEDAVVYRMNTETNQPEGFDAFGPKCLASINKIDPVFNNRCITIHCLRKEKGIRIADLAQCVEEFRQLTREARDMMHCLVLTRFHEVRRIYMVDLMGVYPEIEGREREIWLSLIAMARLVDQDAEWDETKSLVEVILKAQREKESEREEEARRESVDILILQTLLNLITGDEQELYEVRGDAWRYVGNKLAEGIHTELSQDGTWPFEKPLTSNRLTNLLKSQHVIAETDISRSTVGGKRVRVLKIRQEQLRQALQRLHGLDTEDATAPTPAPTQSTAVPARPPAIEEPDDLPF